jgi:hypothetical protein
MTRAETLVRNQCSALLSPKVEVQSMKRQRVYRTAYIVLLVLGVGVAGCAVTTVPKDLWVKGVRDTLPATLCRDGGYFRSCFEFPASECHDAATRATAACLQQYDAQIPQQLRQPSDGRMWGDMVGTCAGTKVEATLTAKRISNAKCNDPSTWQ